ARVSELSRSPKRVQASRDRRDCVRRGCLAAARAATPADLARARPVRARSDHAAAVRGAHGSHLGRVLGATPLTAANAAAVSSCCNYSWTQPPKVKRPP